MENRDNRRAVRSLILRRNNEREWFFINNDEDGQIEEVSSSNQERVADEFDDIVRAREEIFEELSFFHRFHLDKVVKREKKFLRKEIGVLKEINRQRGEEIDDMLSHGQTYLRLVEMYMDLRERQSIDFSAFKRLFVFQYYQFLTFKTADYNETEKRIEALEDRMILLNLFKSLISI